MLSLCVGHGGLLGYVGGVWGIVFWGVYKDRESGVGKLNSICVFLRKP